MRPVKYTFRIGKNGFSKIFRGARRSARILKKRLTSRLKLAKIALCKQTEKHARQEKWLKERLFFAGRNGRTV